MTEPIPGLDPQKLRELGSHLRDLRPITVERSGIHDTPPAGAGELLRKTETEFVFRPIPEEEWRRLTDEQKAELVVLRGRAWLDANINAIVPVSLDLTDPDVKRMFGRKLPFVREFLCKIARWMKLHPAWTTSIHICGVLLARVSGIPGEIGIPIAQLLIEIYSQYYCVDPATS